MHNVKQKRRMGGRVSFVAALSLILFQAMPGMAQSKKNEASYTDFIKKINDGQVQQVDLYPNKNLARFTLKGQPSNAQPLEVNLFNQDVPLTRLLRQRKVNFTFKPEDSGNPATSFLMHLLLGFFLLSLLLLFLRRASNSPGGPGQILNFGKSRARFQMEAQTGICFEDVAGIEEAKEELQEVVTFLKQPEKFTAVGARIPKGVLLVGPPGTGKTLLAKAIAGEASVPFFSISGSEFVEMFVGVGASRVRDLFKKAKENAPCLVFIDEIDAVGRQRGTGIGGGNDEREQTLNQLLTEMDGFEGNTGVIIIAATNRPDVLDTALLRPGRFDRQVMVDLPTFKGRLGILEVHGRTKKLSPEVSLEAIARRTPGFSGADLANLLNEAAILTARRRMDEVTMQEVEDAIDRITIGLSMNPLLDSKKKRMTAYHEVGHALLTTLLPHADDLNKVTIIPRSGGIEGFSQTVPSEEIVDSGLYTRAWILDKIRVVMGGRAADVEVFGDDEMDSGATSDIRKATQLARRMVTQFGMSELGPVALETDNDREVFLGGDWGSRPDYSPQMAAKIDQQVRQLIVACYEDARRLLRAHRAVMDALVDALIERETLDGEEFRAIVNQYVQSPSKTQPVFSESSATAVSYTADPKHNR